MMVRRMGWSLMLAAVLVAGAYGQQPTQLDKVYQAALHKEQVQRDPKGAIEDYRKVAKSSDKALAAKALFRMAECFQKLGDAEATKIYEQLVRDFGGQPEAAEARTRVAAATAGTRTTSSTLQMVRPVAITPTLLEDTGGISFDGRLLAYTTPGAEGGLWVRNLATGQDRRVVENVTNRAMVDYTAAFSRDGKQLAYTWFLGARHQLRVVRLDGTGMPQPRTLVDLDDIGWIRASDWSPDGRSIAVEIVRIDRSTRQIGLVSSQDGTLAVLKSVNWGDGSRMSFSPDGKYLAFGQVGSDRQGDVLVLPMDGSPQIDAAVEPGFDSVIGWSADGKQLIFLSDRSGQPEIWLQSFVDGRFGRATRVSPNTAGVDFLGVVGFTPKGTLYFAVGQGNGVARDQSDIKTMALDFATGKLVAAPTLTVPEYVGSNSLPVWSHNGRLLAYVSRRGSSPAMVLVIRATDGDGRPRDLRPKLSDFRGGLQWSTDDKSLIVQATDFEGRRGIYRVDVQTGDADALMRFGEREIDPQLSSDGSTVHFIRWMAPGTPRGPQSQADFAVIAREVASGTEVQQLRSTHVGRGGPTYVVSPDGKTVYYIRRALDPQRPNGGATAVIAHDVATGGERQLLAEVNPGFTLSLSPDGRFILRNTGGALLLIPTGTGQPTVISSTGGSALCWAADSRSILMRERTSNVDRVWWVPIDGRDRVQLNVEFGSAAASQFQVHPNGRLMVFTHSTRTAGAEAGAVRRAEIFALENFLPPAKSNAKK